MRQGSRAMPLSPEMHPQIAGVPNVAQARAPRPMGAFPASGSAVLQGRTCDRGERIADQSRGWMRLLGECPLLPKDTRIGLCGTQREYRRKLEGPMTPVTWYSPLMMASQFGQALNDPALSADRSRVGRPRIGVDGLSRRDSLETRGFVSIQVVSIRQPVRQHPLKPPPQ